MHGDSIDRITELINARDHRLRRASLQAAERMIRRFSQRTSHSESIKLISLCIKMNASSSMHNSWHFPRFPIGLLELQMLILQPRGFAACANRCSHCAASRLFHRASPGFAIPEEHVVLPLIYQHIRTLHTIRIVACVNHEWSTAQKSHVNILHRPLRVTGSFADALVASRKTLRVHTLSKQHVEFIEPNSVLLKPNMDVFEAIAGSIHAFRSRKRLLSLDPVARRGVADVRLLAMWPETVLVPPGHRKPELHTWIGISVMAWFTGIDYILRHIITQVDNRYLRKLCSEMLALWDARVFFIRIT